MSTSNAELTELRAQVAELSERLAALSAQVASLSAAPALPYSVAGAPEPAENAVTEELLITIAAAVAAYLGKRAPIRHVRLIGSTSWAQQGRVNVQASHGLTVKHTK